MKQHFFLNRGKLHHLKTFSNLDYKTLGFDNGRISTVSMGRG